MRERARPKVRFYAEVSPEADEIKQRLLTELNCSANGLNSAGYRSHPSDE